MTKSNQKSIRMTDEVLAFVEKQKGEGFNQKFENLVLKFKNEEKDLDKRLKEKQQQFDDLTRKVKQLQTSALNLDRLQREIDRCSQYVKKMVDTIEEV